MPSAQARSFLTLLVGLAIGGLVGYSLATTKSTPPGTGLASPLPTEPPAAKLQRRRVRLLADHGHAEPDKPGHTEPDKPKPDEPDEPEEQEEPEKPEEDGKEEGGEEEEGEEEEEEEEEEEHFGGIFALEEFDSRVIAFLICALIVVTIGYEKVVDVLEEKIFAEGIHKALLHKMLGELAVLGFVSFTSTVALQFMNLESVGGEETKESFEFSHVLMFTTAVFYALEIGVVAHMLGQVVGAGGEFDNNDRFEEEELHKKDHTLWQQQVQDMEKRAYDWIADHFAALTAGTWFERRDTRAKSSFKVLRFHFMARNELLGQSKFKWAMYLSMTTERRIEDMISIEIRSWIAMIVLIIVFGMPLQFAMRNALYLFLAFGWLLLFFEILVLLYSEDTLDWLVVKGHEHRSAAELHHERVLVRKSTHGQRGGSRWHGSSMLALLKEVRADQESPTAKASFKELLERARKQADNARDVARIRQHELETAIQVKKNPTDALKVADAIATLKDDAEANSHLEPGPRVTMGPLVLQTVLLMQCMFQALILTMLGREVILAFGVAQGIGIILLMWLPTTLMSLFVTPHVIKNIALARAVVEANHDVLDTMEKELEQEGDYSAASQALELMSGAPLTEEEMKDAEMVRCKVHDLNKLGEMKWRYRVVEEGQNPRDEALKVLDEAKSLMEMHQVVKLGEKPASEAKEAFKKEWAKELSETLWMIGTTKLIFNSNRDEDGQIHTLLTDALHLRQLVGDRPGMADVLNSLGTLEQKRKKPDEAEKVFKRSLELRRHLPEGEDHGKQKQQWIAQSLVSLGNLAIEVADGMKKKEVRLEPRRASRKSSGSSQLFGPTRNHSRPGALSSL